MRTFLRNYWPTVIIGVTAALIACATVVMLSNMPPSTIVMATGPEGGAYYELGKRYRAELARAHVEVRLVTTAGSPENRALLANEGSGVSVALMQGGILRAEDSSKIESLGTVFYEPLWWWFHGQKSAGDRLERLRGRKVSVGPEGSGTRAMFLELAKRNGVDRVVGELLALSPRVAAEKLLSGDIDVAFMMASWNAPVVQQLVGDDRVWLEDYPRADAYVANYPFLHKVVLPRGAQDLIADRPPRDVSLIAAKASIVVRSDLHPAIQYLLLEAATRIHSEQSVFSRANEFPAAEAVGVPLSSEAIRFYRSGPPFLHAYLPFWMAELMGKLIVLLIPILGVFYPMTKYLPALYDWMMRSKILRLYGELALVEDAMKAARESRLDMRDLIVRYDRLEERADRLRMPAAYRSMLYDLRSHIAFVRRDLEGTQSASGAKPLPEGSPLFETGAAQVRGRSRS